MARRRSGPTASIRCMPAARSDCTGRRSLSSERLAKSIARCGWRCRRAAPCVARQHLRRAGVLAGRASRRDDTGDDRRHRADPIEALRADRRQHMRGFADQRDARSANCRGRSNASGNRCRPGSTVSGREWNAIAAPTAADSASSSSASAARLLRRGRPRPRCSARRAAARTRTGLARYGIPSRRFDAAASGRR